MKNNDSSEEIKRMFRELDACSDVLESPFKLTACSSSVQARRTAEPHQLLPSPENSPGVRMKIPLIDSQSPTLMAVHCLRRGYRIELAVCCRMQDASRARCASIDRGCGCEWLDSDRVLEARRIELAPIDTVIAQIREVWRGWVGL